MFDSIFDNIIFLIPVAIIIGRFVAKARNKKKPPPKKPPQPYIPIHFEDDLDDKPVVKKATPVVKEDTRIFPILESNDLFGSQSLSDKPWMPDSQKISSSFLAETKIASVSKEKAAAKKPVPEKRFIPPSDAPVQSDFFLNVNKLSQLKQAVIMSEVLGPPKALQ